MIDEERAQSETLGAVLMTAVLVVSMSVVGVALLSHQYQQAERIDPPATFDTTVDASTVTLTHMGGSDYPLKDLVIIVRKGDTEQRYDLDDPADLSADTLDSDERFEPGETVTVSHGFTGTFRVLLIDSSPGGALLYDESITLRGSLRTVAPQVERFDVDDTSTDGNATFDVTWNVSDPQGDLTSVTLELINDGVVEDSVTRTYGGVASTGVTTDTLTNLSGGGEVYEIRLTAADNFGHETTMSVTDTADNDFGLREPTIETFQAVDLSSGSEVRYDYTYNVSDPDGDLVQVKLELVKEATGVVVDNVTDSYSEVAASGEQTGSLVDPAGSKNDNAQYRINLIASDLGGNDASTTSLDIADGDDAVGGAGQPPTIDTFSVTDTTQTGGKGKADASFDVSWRASDVDGNLANATLQLWDKNKNSMLDSVTYTSADFDSGSDTGTLTTTLTSKNGAGKEYRIVLVVNDDKGKSTSQTQAHAADGDDSGSPP